MSAIMKNTIKGLFPVLLSAMLLACSHAKAPVAATDSAAGAPAAPAAPTAPAAAGAAPIAPSAPAGPAGLRRRGIRM